jgi:hypothetical protein
MCLLLWLTHIPNDNLEENRPLKWFAYEYIDRYRQMSKINFNEIIDPNTKKAILQGVQEYSHLFLTNEAIDLLRQGKDLPRDPFIKGWPSKNLPAIVEEFAEPRITRSKSQTLRSTIWKSIPMVALDTTGNGKYILL